MLFSANASTVPSSNRGLGADGDPFVRTGMCLRRQGFETGLPGIAILDGGEPLTAMPLSSTCEKGGVA